MLLSRGGNRMQECERCKEGRKTPPSCITPPWENVRITHVCIPWIISTWSKNKCKKKWMFASILFAADKATIYRYWLKVQLMLKRHFSSSFLVLRPPSSALCCTLLTAQFETPGFVKYRREMVKESKQWPVSSGRHRTDTLDSFSQEHKRQHASFRTYGYVIYLLDLFGPFGLGDGQDAGAWGQGTPLDEVSNPCSRVPQGVLAPLPSNFCPQPGLESRTSLWAAQSSPPQAELPPLH